MNVWIRPKIIIPLVALSLVSILILPCLIQQHSWRINGPTLAETCCNSSRDNINSATEKPSSRNTTSEPLPPTTTSDELIQALPPWTNRLGDLPDFRFLMNSNTCGKDPVYALLLVGSHPNNRDMRDVIRLTWGNPRLPEFPLKLIFPFGHLTDQNAQLKLEIESRLHGDIIQGNFIDSYNNVTLRDLMSLRWTRFYCQQAQFVVHVDDDMSLDVFSLIDILQEKYSNKSSTEDFMSCLRMMVNTKLYREGRYAVSRQDHPSDLYDPYCLGWLYVLNPAMARVLDDTALAVKSYWLNDAYITGTLIKAANRKLDQLGIRWTMSTVEMAKMLSDWNSTSGKPPTFREFSAIRRMQKQLK